MADRILIIGAGPAGLGAGLALGEQALILENAKNLGGLCQTIEVDGAVLDLGGHSFHTPHADVRELVFRALPMYEQPRNAWCFVNSEWIPYPFQKHFEKLADHAIRDKCRSGLAAAGSGAPARNFGEHLEHRFGSGIVRHFLRPYNEKLWGRNLERLDVDWTRERVAAPVGVTEKFVSSGGRRAPLQDDTQVGYPARGGFGEIFLALARQLSGIRLGEKVVRIDPRRRELATSSGAVLHWRRLVSTLPLPRLLALLPEVPRALTEAAGSLEAMPLALVFVVIGHPVDTPVQRIYCSGSETPAHKIVINHNSSPYLRSLPHHGIVAEVANPGSRSDEELKRQVVSGLETMGLVRSHGDILQLKVIHVEASYPVPTLERSAIVGRLKDFLADRGIDTLGRFGEWAYINSDEALYRGLGLGRKLAEVDHSPLPQPARVKKEGS